MKVWIKLLLKYLVPALILLFLGQSIYTNWSQIREYPWRFNIPLLIAGTVLSSTWFFLRTWIWAQLVREMHRTLPYWPAFRVFLISEVARYLPGKIWQYVSRIYLAQHYRIPPALTLTSALIELLLMMIASGAIALANVSNLVPKFGEQYRTLLLVGVGLSLLLVHPALLKLWSRLLAKFLRQDWIPFDVRYSHLVVILLASLLTWVLAGVGFALFLESLTPEAGGHTAQLIAIYSASWLIGLLAVVVPAGVGVREGVMTMLLGAIVPSPTAAVLSIAVRLWITVLEVVLLAGARLLIPGPPLSKPEDTSTEV
jgi:hypothetical protein